MRLRAPPNSRVPAFPRHRVLCRPGFTLVETSAAMMIMSIAVVAMCELLAAGTTNAMAGGELTIGVNLANTVHEVAVGLPLSGGGPAVIGPYRDVWDMNGRTFSPPIDGGLTPIAGYEGWLQQVVVQTVDNRNIGTAAANDRAAPTARFTVTVYHNGRYVYAGSWLMTGDDP